MRIIREIAFAVAALALVPSVNDYSIPDVRIADLTPSINSGQAILPQVIIAGANPAHINVRSTFYFDRSRR